MEVDSKLVRLAKSGDTQAFSEIYTNIYKELYRYAYYMLNNREDAEDVVAEAVLDMYRSIGKLKDDEKFGCWAMTILSNKCRMKRKQYVVAHERICQEEIQNLKADNQDLEQKYDIEAAMDALDEEERNVVLMSVFAGLKSHEIGACMNMKPTTIRSKLSRALAKMQVYLEIRIGG